MKNLFYIKLKHNSNNNYISLIMKKQKIFQNAKIVDGTPYHVDFPDDWINTEDNEQLICDDVIIRMKTGPRFCGNCSELGVDVNGIFVEYCLNCDDYVYNGMRRISQRSTSVYQKGLNDIHIIRTASGNASGATTNTASNTASNIAIGTASSIGSSIGSGTASSIGSSIGSGTASSIGSGTASSIGSSIGSSIASNTNNIPLFTKYTDITSDY